MKNMLKNSADFEGKTHRFFGDLKGVLMFGDMLLPGGKNLLDDLEIPANPFFRAV